jgi:hypothetical protein
MALFGNHHDFDEDNNEINYDSENDQDFVVVYSEGRYYRDDNGYRKSNIDQAQTKILHSEQKTDIFIQQMKKEKEIFIIHFIGEIISDLTYKY